MKINMNDYYSAMAPYGCIPCSLEDFESLQHVLLVERQRLEAEDTVFCLDIEYIDGELFIYAKHFDCYSLPEKVCCAIGRQLTLSGQEFLEFGYSQTATYIMLKTHGGGAFRIYNDGTLVWPKIIWPD